MHLLLNLARTEISLWNIIALPFNSLPILGRSKRKGVRNKFGIKNTTRYFCKRHGILVSRFMFSINLRKSIHQNEWKIYCHVNYTGCLNNEGIFHDALKFVTFCCYKVQTTRTINVQPEQILLLFDYI